jgi:hypothetical protein
MNRRKRLDKLSSIIYKLSSEIDVVEPSEDIFEKAEKDLPFGISWIKKVWKDSAATGSSELDYSDGQPYFSEVLRSSFFESIFSSAKLDYSSEEYNERMLDEFVSENWKFLYEMSNDEGLRKEKDLKFIGSGSFGIVYKIPSGNILKFADKGYHQVMLEENISRDDYGEIISEKKEDYRTSDIGTKYLPKILDIYKLIIGDRHLYVTLMKEVVPLEKITEGASSVSFNVHLMAINKIVFDTISKTLKDVFSLIMIERKKIDFNISYKKNFYINEKFSKLTRNLDVLSFGPMASTISAIGKDWDDLLKSIDEAFTESLIEYISPDETDKMKSIEDLINFLRSNYWEFIEGDIKKMCEDNIMNISDPRIKSFKKYVDSFMQKKLREDWHKVFAKSFVHSTFRGNTDITHQNMGFDDRGYLVIFDG